MATALILKWQNLLDMEDKNFLNDLANQVNANLPDPTQADNDAKVRERIGYLSKIIMKLDDYKYKKFDGPTAYVINNIFNDAGQHKFALLPYLNSKFSPIDQAIMEEWFSRIERGQSTDASFISREVLKTAAVVVAVAAGGYAIYTAIAPVLASSSVAAAAAAAPAATTTAGAAVTASTAAAATTTATAAASSGGILAGATGLLSSVPAQATAALTLLGKDEINKAISNFTAPKKDLVGPPAALANEVQNQTAINPTLAIGGLGLLLLLFI